MQVRKERKEISAGMGKKERREVDKGKEERKWTHTKDCGSGSEDRNGGG